MVKALRLVSRGHSRAPGSRESDDRKLASYEVAGFEVMK